MKNSFWAAGKLLLFGEYLALNGTDTLAIPLKFGQSLKVFPFEKPGIYWESKTNDNIWFKMQSNADLELISFSSEQLSKRLISILKLIFKEKMELFNQGLHFEVQSNFDLNWGFGSSSTLISLLAQWSGVDPYRLLSHSFGGSGYDIACATAHTPIIYNRNQHHVKRIELPNSITDNLLFVYSGKKQNSQNEIQKFESALVTETHLKEQQSIIQQASTAKTIEIWEDAISKNEQLISKLLQRETLKSLNFKDYAYAIKSLGAWGGDFFMATYREEQSARDYFNTLGYPIQFNYQEIIYNKNIITDEI
ncbi:MAG TPA: GYDIA family GHMP kinase [Edaphocola sp.]|nr:GYDIA family GHMP kinase [Edaphocola sp.]